MSLNTSALRKAQERIPPSEREEISDDLFAEQKLGILASESEFVVLRVGAGFSFSTFFSKKKVERLFRQRKAKVL